MTRFDMIRTTAPLRGAAARLLRDGLNGLAVTSLALLLVACTAPRPGTDLPPYGDSVRHAKALQTYEPDDKVPPLHGAKAAEAMRTYRIPPSGGGQAPGSKQ